MALRINSKWRKFEKEIEGEMVSMEIKPMTTFAFHRTMALVMKHQAQFVAWPKDATQKEFDDATKIANEQSVTKMISDPDLVEMIKEIFPNHVRNLQGIEIETEEGIIPAPVNALYEQGPLIQLSFAVLMELVAISRLTEDEAKNSLGEPVGQ